MSQSVAKKDLTGRRSGKLTVIELDHIRTFPSGQRQTIWLCLCDCGVATTVQYSGLISSKSKSCGTCLRTPENEVFPMFSREDRDLAKMQWLEATGYARRNHEYAHRIVLSRKLGRPLTDGEMVDHINRNKLDNRRSNLRLADKSLNSVNRDKRPDNSSGYIGVYRHYPKKHQERGWKPSYFFLIERKGHKKFYGKHYKTPKEAHEARLEKLKEYEY